MVYKKFIKRNGKLYGPYYYSNKRVNGRVITRYHGIARDSPPQDAKKLLLSILFTGLVVITLLLLFEYISLPTGKVTLDIKPKYKAGEELSGKLKFNIKEGELIPKDSKIVVSIGEDINEFNLADLVVADAITGNFFADNIGLLGKGEGYGLIGHKEIYPEINFELKIFYPDRELGEKEEIIKNESRDSPEENKTEEQKENETLEEVRAG